MNDILETMRYIVDRMVVVSENANEAALNLYNAGFCFREGMEKYLEAKQ